MKHSTGRASKAPVLSNAKRYPGLAGSLAGVPAYGVDVYPGGNFVSWPDASVPGTWNVVAPAATYFAGDFLNGDFSTLYALNYDTSALTTINTATGAATVVGPSTPGAGESWSGLTGAPGGNPLRLRHDVLGVDPLHDRPGDGPPDGDRSDHQRRLRHRHRGERRR